MKLEWLGHACFRITTGQGLTVVTDPYDESVGYGRLNVQADIVTMSHQHHDHNCLEGVHGFQRTFDDPYDEDLGSLRIRAIESFHDGENGLKRGKNLIFRFEADGQSAVHLGDLGHMPDKAQLDFISSADVLLVPVGGFYTIDTPAALKIVSLSAPKAAVAMHFRNACCAFPISTAEEFAHALNAKSMSGEKEIGELRGAYVPEL